MKEDREIHEDFVTCLTLHARRRYERTPDTFALVLAAVRNGWKPQDLAKACSQSLPTAPPAAAQQINRVLAWARDTKPTPARQPRTHRPKRHVCNHPDGHICPWLDQLDGTVTRCSCDSPGGSA